MGDSGGYDFCLTPELIATICRNNTFQTVSSEHYDLVHVFSGHEPMVLCGRRFQVRVVNCKRTPCFGMGDVVDVCVRRNAES